ncbi:MAG: Ca2+-binding EF-hand superfamily protein [Kiritimatiellia bacterium]|jgi:Ca2+-binding EF-hand superfamily protein
MNKMITPLAVLAACTFASVGVPAQNKNKPRHDPKIDIITTFELVDMDKDGVIVAEEFFVYVKELSFKQLDTDKNGTISYAEWLVEESGEVGQELFERMDKNKDLKLTRGEFTNTPRMRDVISRLFHTLDRDSDKQLKKDELLNDDN